VRAARAGCPVRVWLRCRGSPESGPPGRVSRSVRPATREVSRMVTSRDATATRWRGAASLRRHAAPHVVAVLSIGLAAVVAALATFAFQVTSARAIGPEDFGLLAAFLAILNVAAIASSAMQNTVAVGIAETSISTNAVPTRRGPSEVTLLGTGFAVVVLALTPVLVHLLHTDAVVVLVAVAVIPLCFWLSEAVGVLQGLGRAAEATWWPALALVARVAIMVVALALGLGIAGVLTAVLISTALGVVVARIPVRRVPRATGVFSATGLTVLLLSLLLAWLLNSDVIALRVGAPGVVAGTFASAAILVKAVFMLPSTLSVYLLPRFVRNRGNEQLVRVGERVTLGVTAVSGLALAAVFWLFGDLIVRLLYGAAFAQSGGLLFKLSLAYLPWIMAWSVYIRLIARASRPAVAVLVVAAILQGIGFWLAVPDVTALMWVQAVIGVAVLISFFVLVRRLDNPTDASAAKSSAAHQVA